MPACHWSLPLYAQAAASKSPKAEVKVSPTPVDSCRLTNLDPDQPTNLVLKRKKRPKPARIISLTSKARDKLTCRIIIDFAQATQVPLI